MTSGRHIMTLRSLIASASRYPGPWHGRRGRRQRCGMRNMAGGRLPPSGIRRHAGDNVPDIIGVSTGRPQTPASRFQGLH